MVLSSTSGIATGSLAFSGVRPMKIGGPSAFGKVISVATGGETLPGPWLVWSNKSCSYHAVAKHPSSFVFKLRKAVQPVRIGYAQYGITAGGSFIVSNNQNIAANVKKAGLIMRVFNNNYPSQTDPITAAEDTISEGSDLSLNANAQQALYPAIFSRMKKACIPTLVMYLSEAGYPWFGTSWPNSGISAGQYVASKIKSWSPKSVTILICADKAVGPSVEIADTTFERTLKKERPNIPAGNWYSIECGPTGQGETAPVSAWLVSHPSINNLIVFSLDDEHAQGAYVALSRAGRKISVNTLNIGIGLDQLGVANIYSGKETMSISFFPELYGNYIVPLLEAIYAGTPIPSASGTQTTAIDRSNIAKYYLKNGKPVKRG